MIAVDPAEIRTEHLPNTNIERYLEINLLGFKLWFSEPKR
jgi:hypothetical protein